MKIGITAAVGLCLLEKLDDKCTRLALNLAKIPLLNSYMHLTIFYVFKIFYL